VVLLVTLPEVAVTVITRFDLSPPMPRLATSFPVSSVVLVPELTTPPLSAVTVTGTLAKVLRLLSIAVTVMVTVLESVLAIWAELVVRSRSAAPPPPLQLLNGQLPALPPPPPQATRAIEADRAAIH